MIRIFLVRQYQNKILKTFFVDNGWTIFAVLFLLIHLCWKMDGEKKDRTTDPGGVFPIWWGNDLSRHCLGC